MFSDYVLLYGRDLSTTLICNNSNLTLTGIDMYQCVWLLMCFIPDFPYKDLFENDRPVLVFLGPTLCEELQKTNKRTNEQSNSNLYHLSVTVEGGRGALPRVFINNIGLKVAPHFLHQCRPYLIQARNKLYRLSMYVYVNVIVHSMLPRPSTQSISTTLEYSWINSIYE